MLASLFVVILGLCFCSKGSSQSILGRPEVIGPSEVLVNSIVDFKCELKIYPENETILLQIFKKENRNNLLAEYTSLNGEVAIMPMIIDLSHDGGLECVAKAQNNSKIEPTVSYTHYLKVVEPVKGASLEVASGSVDSLEGKTLKLHCYVISGNHVSYKWLLNNQLVSQSPLHNVVDNQLVINRTTSKDSGSYMCVATNHFNKTYIFTSNSSEVMITVKDVLSNLDISFTVLKEDSHNYSAEVTCQSTKGTPPVTFSLYNGTELVTNITVKERVATFKVPLVLDQFLGRLQCQANNGDRIIFSQWIPLEVVPVGGPVIMHYDYDVGENYAVIGLRFYCKAAKGSFPQYQWFLNKTLLHDRGNFYYVVNQPPEQSILLLSVGKSSAGTYHCEVLDSFDNTSFISSDELYLDKEVLNRLSSLVVAVVFGCFTFLVVLVSICCLVGAMFRQRQNEGKSLLSLEMDVAAHEGELDPSEYEEDTGLGETTRGDAFDLIFALVVFACITTEGYINSTHSSEVKCIFNQNDSACHYSVGIGVIAFLACVAFIVVDIYLPFMSNAQERKYAVIADLVFSGVWCFLWFVCFCLLASQWAQTHDVTGVPQDAARATVAFSFFSIATWGILTYIALVRFRRGVNETTIPTFSNVPPDHHTPFPPTYAPTSYNPTTYTPTTYNAYPSNVPDMHQQPPLLPNPQPQGDADYQPPSY